LVALATLVGLLATALSPGIASALSFAAKASVSPKIQYVGDSAGSTFTLKVKNTGTVQTIGAVSVSRPSAFWSMTACPTRPSGWTVVQTADSCTYRSAAGSAGNIARNHTATFSFTAATAPSVANRAGNWNVNVTTLDDFSNPSWVKEAGAMAPYLNVKAYSFEINSFGIADSAATVGDPCPPMAKHAPAGATGKVVVVCGTNHTNASQLLKQSYSRLNGDFIASRGSFASSTVGAGATDVVLGNWSNVTIADIGTNVWGRVGAFSGRTSPPTHTGGYTVDNVAPIANDDPDYSVDEDGALLILGDGVKGNDTDANGDPMTVVQDTGPAHAASFNLDSSGQFSYTPNANFHGTDTFTYHVNDGALDSNIATVTITVNSVNDPPSAVNDSGASYTINEDNPLSVTAPGVLGNDTDVDLDSLTASLVAGPSHAQSFSLGSNGSVSYTPVDNFHGTDTFTYKANDGTADSNIATATITVTSVNDAPVAVDDSFTVVYGTPLSFDAAHGLATDVTDVDGDTLTYEIVSQPTGWAPPSGFSLNTTTGAFSYAVAAGTTSDSFTWRAFDGTNYSNTVTMTITVDAGGGGGGGGGCLKVC
jgi:VCBS repeat-containing protein